MSKTKEETFNQIWYWPIPSNFQERVMYANWNGWHNINEKQYFLKRISKYLKSEQKRNHYYYKYEDDWDFDTHSFIDNEEVNNPDNPVSAPERAAHVQKKNSWYDD